MGMMLSLQERTAIANEIEHHGVKGMHWGQHKSESSTKGPAPVEVRRGLRGTAKAKGGQHHDLHPDAINAAVSKQKARKNSTDALSNKELQDLVTRLNLEQQYSRLVTGPDRRTDGGDVNLLIKKVVGAGKTANDLHNFSNTPTGKAVKAALKGALKAKVGG